MSWRDRTALLLEKAAGAEVPKLTKAPHDHLSSLLSLPPQAHSGENVAGSDTREQAEARRLYYRYAERNGFTDTERDADIAPILESPEAWITYLQGLEAEAGAGDTEAPPQLSNASASDPEQPAGYLHSEQTALACTRCRNIDMSQGVSHQGRRQYLWVCRRGHRILRGGCGLEDVLLAPPTCSDYDDTPLTGPGVFH